MRRRFGSARSAGRSARSTSQAGFVQLIVVSALAVLGGLLSASLLGATQTSRQAAALERLVRSEVVADAGFRRLVAAIEDPSDTLENAALQEPTKVAFAANELSLRIEANGSKIDVLVAEPQLIERYASQAGLDTPGVAGLLDELGAARRDQDGAKALELVRVALTGLLPGDELNHDFTRFGGSGIDPTYASRRVLHAVPDLSLADADRIAAASPAERAQEAQLSRYFASGGRRFALVTQVATSEWRLPIEISTAGKVIVLAGRR